MPDCGNVFGEVGGRGGGLGSIIPFYFAAIRTEASTWRDISEMIIRAVPG
jgi:hypothetical protein